MQWSCSSGSSSLLWKTQKILTRAFVEANTVASVSKPVLPAPVNKPVLASNPVYIRELKEVERMWKTFKFEKKSGQVTQFSFLAA